MVEHLYTVLMLGFINCRMVSRLAHLFRAAVRRLRDAGRHAQLPPTHCVKPDLGRFLAPLLPHRPRQARGLSDVFGRLAGGPRYHFPGIHVGRAPLSHSTWQKFLFHQREGPLDVGDDGAFSGLQQGSLPDVGGLPRDLLETPAATAPN